MPTEIEYRAAVIAEARSWLRTPWRHRAAIKGEAVDCAMFLAESYIAPGWIERFDPGPYPKHWFLHRDEERFLGWIVDHFHGVEIPVAQAQPADLIVYQLGRCYAHGAIYLGDHLVIHSYSKTHGVSITEDFDPDLASRRPRAFDMFAHRRTA